MERVRYYDPDLGVQSQSSGYPGTSTSRYPVPEGTEHNLISSFVAGASEWERGHEATLHAPTLDIDLPVRVVDSETPGHHHLFIDKEMTWAQYATLLLVLEDVGILEPGYVRASLERGATYVASKPWKRPASDIEPF